MVINHLLTGMILQVMVTDSEPSQLRQSIFSSLSFTKFVFFSQHSQPSFWCFFFWGGKQFQQVAAKIPDAKNHICLVRIVLRIHCFRKKLPCFLTKWSEQMRQLACGLSTCQISGPLPETNSKFAPKNGWLEYDPFLLGRPIFRGYVSLPEGIPGQIIATKPPRSHQNVGYF